MKPRALTPLSAGGALGTSHTNFTAVCVEFEIEASLDQWHGAVSKSTLLVLPVLPLQEERNIYNMIFTTAASQGLSTAKLRMWACTLIAH